MYVVFFMKWINIFKYYLFYLLLWKFRIEFEIYSFFDEYCFLIYVFCSLFCVMNIVYFDRNVILIIDYNLKWDWFLFSILFLLIFSFVFLLGFTVIIGVFLFFVTFLLIVRFVFFLGWIDFFDVLFVFFIIVWII